MKLTLTIDTATASPAALAALRTLLNEATAPAVQADPLADHPELPLGVNTDPTLREFPWGDLPEPPDTPAGKRWVNRGTFEDRRIHARGREVRFLVREDNAWGFTFNFSGDYTHIELVDA